MRSPRVESHGDMILYCWHGKGVLSIKLKLLQTRDGSLNQQLLFNLNRMAFCTRKRRAVKKCNAHHQSLGKRLGVRSLRAMYSRAHKTGKCSLTSIWNVLTCPRTTSRFLQKLQSSQERAHDRMAWCGRWKQRLPSYLNSQAHGKKMSTKGTNTKWRNTTN